MTTIFIAEDHALVREGMKLLLSIEVGLEVVGDTGDGAVVEQLVFDAKPDIVLLDLDLPNCHGSQLAMSIKAHSSATKVLIVTGCPQPDSLRRALAAGADGYVLKQEDSSELMLAIRALVEGRTYISKNLAEMFYPERFGYAEYAGMLSTRREQEIMGMIARGLTNEEIAVLLDRSVLTIRKHRQNLMEKLGLHNAAEITAYAIKHHLYSPT
jgi:DNA-binding NarL/FixJ family response regulator